MRNQRIIDLRYILTPLATVYFQIGGITRKRYYIFGFKVVDLSV